MYGNVITMNGMVNMLCHMITSELSMHQPLANNFCSYNPLLTGEYWGVCGMCMRDCVG